jgi:hypothetical protein
VHGLNILLLHCLDGHKAHGGAAHGFIDGFGVIGIVLLDVQFEKLRGDQPNKLNCVFSPLSI